MPDETIKPGARGSLSVLVVEDEFLIAMDIEMMLEQEGRRRRHGRLGRRGAQPSRRRAARCCASGHELARSARLPRCRASPEFGHPLRPGVCLRNHRF